VDSSSSSRTGTESARDIGSLLCPTTSPARLMEKPYVPDAKTQVHNMSVTRPCCESQVYPTATRYAPPKSHLCADLITSCECLIRDDDNLPSIVIPESNCRRRDGSGPCPVMVPLTFEKCAGHSHRVKRSPTIDLSCPWILMARASLFHSREDTRWTYGRWHKQTHAKSACEAPPQGEKSCYCQIVPI